MGKIEQNNQNKCEECEFFLEHYIRFGESFFQVSYGHCGQGVEKKPPNACEKWRHKQAIKPKTRTSIKNYIETIHDRLDEIALFLRLNDDNL